MNKTWALKIQLTNGGYAEQLVDAPEGEVRWVEFAGNVFYPRSELVDWNKDFTDIGDPSKVADPMERLQVMETQARYVASTGVLNNDDPGGTKFKAMMLRLAELLEQTHAELTVAAGAATLTPPSQA